MRFVATSPPEDTTKPEPRLTGFPLTMVMTVHTDETDFA
jgi:hypothetical protein